ncbi:MAG: FKBP-type peptidyl-prolyl cis-trans isomerase [Lentisphaeraceae bacterium]|nr:FKBP-type peptidyl-prolyl cis-trans isomerase [Lentisphaeraceae bacterium]
MDTDNKKTSYLIGLQVAGNLVNQGIELDVESFTTGVTSGLAGEECAVPAEEAGKLMMALEEQIKERLQKQRIEVAGKNKEAGEKFLAENSSKDGVKVTATGLQYKVLVEGDGAVPAATDTVETHYEGTLINGEVFDSSIQRGQTVSFPVSGVIKGWQEALQLMSVGSKWEVYIPYDLAYGEAGSPPKIGPFSALVFQVELIKIV